MRTKHLITAMVLPALFAACTAEELVENNATALQGRALLDPNFSISVEGNGVDSRFSWNEAAFGWNAFTANDKFSAGLVDDASGTIQDKVLTNYIFSSEDATNYTTTSQMVEGAYFFYSYPGFETSAARAEVPFDLTSQVKVDLNNPAATVETNQLFVSPIYTLKAKKANEKLPLYFISYWSTAAVKVKNTSGSTMKIRRITLTDATNEFAVKGKLSPKALKTSNLVYTWNDEANTYVLPNNVVKENIKLAAIHDADPTIVKTQDVITVDCQAYELANGEEALAYIQVPAGRHTSVGVDIVVEIETSLGTALKDIKFDMVANGTDGAGAACVDFKRGHTIPVYGIEDGGVKAFVINKIVLASAEAQTGVYADSYEALESIVLNNDDYDGDANDPIVVNNLGALQLNDDVMYLLSQTNKVVKFQNEIEVTSEGNGIVKNAQFAKGAKVVAGNITFKDGVVLDANQILTINEDATATIAEGTWNNVGSKISNSGILTLAKNNIAITNIENSASKGHVVIGANVTLGTGGVVAMTAAKSLTVNSNKEFIVNKAYTIGRTQSITNYGTITSSDYVDGTNTYYYLTNKGTITNNGTIEECENAAGYYYGTTWITPTINNYGVLNNVKNSALIDQKEATAEVNNPLGSGNINNTIDGIVVNSANTVYASYTGNQSGKLGNVMGCTKVLLTSGIWTNPSVATNVTDLSLSGVTLNSSSSTIDMKSVQNLSMTSSIANKNLIFGKADAAMTSAVLDGSTFNANLTLTGLQDLELRSVTFNGAVSASSVSTLTIKQMASNASANNVATTIVNGELTITGTLAVEQYANLTVTTIGSITGVTTITNSGEVVNKGSINATTAGSTDGVWSGNVTE